MMKVFVAPEGAKKVVLGEGIEYVVQENGRVTAHAAHTAHLLAAGFKEIEGFTEELVEKAVEVLKRAEATGERAFTPPKPKAQQAAEKAAADQLAAKAATDELAAKAAA